MINIEKGIKEIYKSTPYEEPVIYDPYKSKMLDHKKRGKSMVKIGKENKWVKKYHIRKHRRKNKDVCQKAISLQVEYLDDLIPMPVIKGSEGWETW